MAPSLPTPELAQAPARSIAAPAPSPGPPPRAPSSQGASSNSVAEAQANAVANIPPHISRQVVATGLEAATDLAVTNEADVIYTERLNGLWVRRSTLESVGLWTPDQTNWGKSASLHSLALDPDFANSKVLYVLVLSASGQRVDTGVVRLRLKSDLSGVVEQKVILSARDIAQGTGSLGSTAQASGKLRMGPDGLLYLGLGDFRSTVSPQSPNALAGKVLRFNAFGEASPANRVPVGTDTRIFAYGLRSPVGISFHPNTEELILVQQGAGVPDELAIASAGSNGGGSRSCTSAEVASCEGGGKRSANWRVLSSWGVSDKGDGASGLERLQGQAWREWRNGVAVSFQGNRGIDLLKIDAKGKVLRTAQILKGMQTSFGPMADGPDGLYVVARKKDGSSEIWRLKNN